MQRRSGLDRRGAVGAIAGQLPAPLAWLHRFSITRYLLASIVSLAFDMATFLTLVALSINATWSSALGYSAGIVVHWLISASFVFPGKTREGVAKQVQQAGFVGSALVGLALTVGIVELATGAGTLPIVAKGLAVGISFFVTYALRKYGVFR